MPTRLATFGRFSIWRELAGVADGIAVFEALVTSGMAFAIAGLEEARTRSKPRT